MIEQLLGALITVILIVLALSVKALRKSIGVLFIILGAIACLTIIGVIIGIPMILVGGILLFI